MGSRRVNVRGIIYKNGKLFAQTIKTTGTTTTYWCTPGGGLDLGESLVQGLEREMIEETGVKPVVGKLLFIQQFSTPDEAKTSHGYAEQLEFFFHITNPDDYEAIDLSATSHGDIEIDQCDFVNPKRTHVLPAFLQSIDIEHYIDSGQPVLIKSDELL